MLESCCKRGKSLGVILGLALLLAGVSLPFHLPGALAAQAEETPTGILDGAKREGKLVFYTAASLTVGNEILKKFREKYPFIQTDIYRTGSQAMLTRVLAEAQSKKNICDVVNLPGGESLTLKKKGFFAKYISPQSKYYPEGYKDPEGYWTDVYLTMNGIVYNAKMLPPQDVPKSWQDLLHPRWKGKIGLDSKSFEWLAYMLKIMGQKKGLEYMEKLAEQNLKFYSTRTLLPQLVAAGEINLGLVYRADIELWKDRGAPLDWVGIEPIIPSIHPIGISAQAPHPHAARLFVDFALSREGQEAWVRVHRVPSRPDIKPLRLKKEMNIMTPDFTLIGDYEKYGKLYREILMKK